MNIQSFLALPNIPDNLSPLTTLAKNLWFSWNNGARDIFKRLDSNQVSNPASPIEILNSISQTNLADVMTDDSFLSFMHSVFKQYVGYFSEDTWFNQHYLSLKSANAVIGYFSMEFGLDVSVPIYSGGLGILAGDHLKAASDLGVPLVGVGLLYRNGYFCQYLNSDGWQQEYYPENDFYNMPMTLEVDKSGVPILIAVPYLNGQFYAQIWRCEVGRVSLFLLDTNIATNAPEDRGITARLYGGDSTMRIKQEILIGIGGVRALYALGLNPVVCHMNEGHAAFLSIERIRMLMATQSIPLNQAIELVHATNVFTTHTPVPAGNDRFGQVEVWEALASILTEIGLEKSRFLELGYEKMDGSELFCMTVFALKLASFSNGVSDLHGQVSRQMWQFIWPTIPVFEVPIGHITNGIHLKTWVGHDLADLYDQYLGPKWGKSPDEHQLWKRVADIPDIELWSAHERKRERLVAFARQRLANSASHRGTLSVEAQRMQTYLNPKALTIGFAKRFATYKRAALIFKDLDRIIRILNNEKYPVQLIFSGKAHPLDNPGKRLIQSIAHYARMPEFAGKIVFLENYDMLVAHHLVQGCDVWLNNPRRPLEASGTSGMKASVNGVLNVSVLDGWWCEGYEADTGWAIGLGEEYADTALQDDIESKSIYDLLECEVIPLFYQRGVDGLPRQWIQKMKTCIQKIAPEFSTNRMVSQYVDRYYAPCLSAHSRFTANQFSELAEFSKWLENLKPNWQRVRVVQQQTNVDGFTKVGDAIWVEVTIDAPGLASEDLSCDLIYGRLNADGQFVNPQYIKFKPVDHSGHQCRFRVDVPIMTSGKIGITTRVLPQFKGRPLGPEWTLWG